MLDQFMWIMFIITGGPDPGSVPVDHVYYCRWFGSWISSCGSCLLLQVVRILDQFLWIMFIIAGVSDPGSVPVDHVYYCRCSRSWISSCGSCLLLQVFRILDQFPCVTFLNLSCNPLTVMMESPDCKMYDCLVKLVLNSLRIPWKDVQQVIPIFPRSVTLSLISIL